MKVLKSWSLVGVAEVLVVDPDQIVSPPKSSACSFALPHPYLFGVGDVVNHRPRVNPDVNLLHCWAVLFIFTLLGFGSGLAWGLIIISRSEPLLQNSEFFMLFSSNLHSSRWSERKQVRFQQTHNQGLRQLFLTVSRDFCAQRSTPDAVLVSL